MLDSTKILVNGSNDLGASEDKHESCDLFEPKNVIQSKNQLKENIGV